VLGYAQFLSSILPLLLNTDRQTSIGLGPNHFTAVIYFSAVLENHHAAMGFLLTNSEDKSNILKNLDPDEYEKMRRNVIDMVLATEMAKHFENLQRFIHICKANMRTMEEDLSIQVSWRSRVMQSSPVSF